MVDPNRYGSNDPLPFHAVVPTRHFRLTEEGLKVYDFFAAQNLGRAAARDLSPSPPQPKPDRTVSVTEEELARTIGPLLDIPEVPPLIEEELPSGPDELH
jgi:hypothetical protein